MFTRIAMLFVVSAVAGTLVRAAQVDGEKQAATGARADDASKRMPRQIKQAADLLLKQKSFSFVRVEYTDERELGETRPRRVGLTRIWQMDYPQSDLNFSKRLATTTGLQTQLDGKSMPLTYPELKDYPFLYIVEGGHMRLDRDEVDSLRAYLLGGGFLMIDDFWGDAEWQNVSRQLKQVFPDREPKELELEHPIFHSFYDLTEKPQVFHIRDALLKRAGNAVPEEGNARYLGVTDDKGRLMVLVCHNTDLGDGWERDGDDPFYSQEYSQKRAYPMGINIVVYVLSQSGAQ